MIFFKHGTFMVSMRTSAPLVESGSLLKPLSVVEM